MSPETARYALFGNPVGHSLSPAMHNAAYEAMGLSARYLAIPVEDAGAIPGIMEEKGIRGASVTLPHKRAILEHLDEASPACGEIGAANTLVRKGDRLRGENTDWEGFVLSIRERLEIRGKVFAVVGAGGAAHAAVYGILEEGGTPVVINRSPDTGRALAERFGCPFVPLEEAGRVEASCLVQATSVGITAAPGWPLKGPVLSRFPWVMDMVYTPLRTAFLEEAERMGCRIIPGLAMFVYQGAAQIRLWTGRRPPVETMRNIVLERLSHEGSEKGR
ncbi:MAG TPA: shikimate dehydrogenase [Syntrophales bacterium]|nr:shikimate dehydrogenase [Syntrophales bacterium]